MLVLLLDAVGTDVDLPEPLLLVSLPCLPFMLEQIDFKLKSSDLKLIILKFRFTDFFADWAAVAAFDGGLVVSHFGDASSILSSSTPARPQIVFCCVPSASLVLLVISKRSEFLLILFELSTC